MLRAHPSQEGAGLLQGQRVPSGLGFCTKGHVQLLFFVPVWGKNMSHSGAPGWAEAATEALAQAGPRLRGHSRCRWWLVAGAEVMTSVFKAVTPRGTSILHHAPLEGCSNGTCFCGLLAPSGRLPRRGWPSARPPCCPTAPTPRTAARGPVSPSAPSGPCGLLLGRSEPRPLHISVEALQECLSRALVRSFQRS